jgi:hypothetical protein
MGTGQGSVISPLLANVYLHYVFDLWADRWRRREARRSRTAKTSRISRRAVKSRCAHEWGGWGRLSDDGSRQHNSGKSEDPWGSGNPTSWWCTIELTTRHCAGQTVGPRCARRMDANWLTCPRMSGVDLSSCGSQEGPI